MGASVKAWVVPGSWISSDGAPGVGDTTFTTGMAASTVVCFSVASAVAGARVADGRALCAGGRLPRGAARGARRDPRVDAEAEGSRHHGEPEEEKAAAPRS